MPLPSRPRALLSDTEAALSRIGLSQFASHGSATGADAAHGRAVQPAQWIFEIPLTMETGTTMAQFQITHEDQNGGAYDQPEAAG
ncbi:hypothetical protein [Breoghania sp.]|uniref:hypothetical protein n=1 Tax=Breoghania sp. TaxID=2065378 RepID=UPI0026173E03|nr:hypothetical protein [Breoghania sp.]MDJ0932217.1 hypothetical protein [Breoghania sp.]